ncbi:hypothetical protein [Ferroglobus sp.]|uniref:hypothetical protein n=1 Tax=Ferroglobus sp. TaxID=2614230 RepID=UPI0025B8E93F|nr:hypothetical protein [Ferroglobus sp.]
MPDSLNAGSITAYIKPPRTSKFVSLFEEISNESIRIYYHIIKKVVKHPERKKRRLIAIDETKLKLENKHIFVWNAIDVDTKEHSAIWAF